NGTANPEEFEQRIFSPMGNSKTDAILDKLNQQRARTRDRSAGNTQLLDDLQRSFDTLTDGMDGKLNNAARYFEIDPNEIDKEDYSYRYDTTFQKGSKYDTKDLDLKKPAAQKYAKRDEFIVSTKEVLSQADFRVSISVRVVLL
ncbi:ribosomal protein S18, partial [Trifolium pratense]